MSQNIVERHHFDADYARTPFEITVFDTAIGSQNLGDQIISNAVYEMLYGMFPQAHLWSIPTHDTFGAAGRKRQRHSLFSITTGTNILSKDMPRKGLWKLPRYFRPEIIPFGFLTPRNLVLCAAGSNASDLSSGASRFLKKSLWKGMPASVRDINTRSFLERAGVGNPLHTSCVTLWTLPKDHEARLPKQKARDVVMTVTGTRRAPAAYIQADKSMVDILLANYETVYFWPQGQVDLEYLAMIGLAGVTLIDSNLAAFTKLLRDSNSLDYVGSRLHAGIHAIQNGRRSLIIPVDNRASDISSSIGLPTLAAHEINRLVGLIEQDRATSLQLPWADIELWKTSLLDAVRTGLPPTINLSAFSKNRDK